MNPTIEAYVRSESSMAPPIQAGSLANVMELADNPPKDPQDRTLAEVQQPLVLYIARVPGSKGESDLNVWLEVHKTYQQTRYLPYDDEATGKDCYCTRRTKLALLSARG